MRAIAAPLLQEIPDRFKKALNKCGGVKSSKAGGWKFLTVGFPSLQNWTIIYNVEIGGNTQL